MKIIEAYWEKRNLNKNAIEVVVEHDDVLENVIEKLKLIQCDYLVVKAPIGNYRLNRELTGLGFVFVEHSITARNKLYEYNLPQIYQRLLRAMDYEAVAEENLALLYDSLDDGIFETDRVALDPQFSTTISNERYKNWINDELGKQSKLYFVIYKGERVGFFLLQSSEKSEVFAPLSGVFEPYKHLKLGYCLNCLIHKAAEPLGYKFVKTTFTSNNRGAFSIHASQSYTLLEQSYVFVKHIK